MAAFQEKLSAGEVVVVNNFNIEKPRTKDMISILKNLGLNDKSVLIVLPGTNNTVELSARNIPGVGIVNVSDLTTYDVVAFNTLLMTKEAVTRLEEIKGS